MDPGQNQVQGQDVQGEVRVYVQKHLMEKIQVDQTEEVEGDKTE